MADEDRPPKRPASDDPDAGPGTVSELKDLIAQQQRTMDQQSTANADTINAMMELMKGQQLQIGQLTAAIQTSGQNSPGPGAALIPVQGGAPGGQPVHTPKLTAILKTKVEDASLVQEKNMKALNQAKQAGASLQKILDETPGDVKDRLPNDFPPTARMKPAVKLHSGGGMPVEDLSDLQLEIDQGHRDLQYTVCRTMQAAQARIAAYVDKSMAQVEQDLQGELHALHEHTAIPDSEIQCDVQAAMTLFQDTTLKAQKRIELERKEKMRVKAENKANLAKARLEALKKERSTDTLLSVIRAEYQRMSAVAEDMEEEEEGDAALLARLEKDDALVQRLTRALKKKDRKEGGEKKPVKSPVKGDKGKKPPSKNGKGRSKNALAAAQGNRKGK